jgi:DNA (cytosine-5)-methyltransferase 1
MTSKTLKNQLAYLDLLKQELLLSPKQPIAPLVIDLFAGCGGFVLGFEAAGFRTIGYEMLADACATYRHNLQSSCYQITLTPASDLVDGADVIIGGPPCQPFSVGGNQRGLKDSRDGFPTFLSAVERYRPKLALFENVQSFSAFCEGVLC